MEARERHDNKQRLIQEVNCWHVFCIRNYTGNLCVNGRSSNDLKLLRVSFPTNGLIANPPNILSDS